MCISIHIDNNVWSILVLIAGWDLVNQLDLKLNERPGVYGYIYFLGKGLKQLHNSPRDL